ncbi:MAG: hypothetical protein ABI444_01745 [Candidatus Kapaibacterium sp.]
MKIYLHLTLLLTVLAIAGCTDHVTNMMASTYHSVPLTIGTGNATTWITTDGSGNLSAIGITISDAALASLGTHDSMYELPMPTGISCAFKSIALDFATHDNAPYNLPHLDPHFMLIDMATRMGIMDTEDRMMPTNMMMPSGYRSDGMSELMMGVHWMDTTGSEFHGSPFECTFDYGTSKGDMIFYELMCEKASLESHKAFNKTIRKPTMMGGMMMSMTIPSAYKVSYDQNGHTTTFELNGF